MRKQVEGAAAGAPDIPRLSLPLCKVPGFRFEGLRRADARAKLLALCGFEGDPDDYSEEAIDRALLRAAQEALKLHRLLVLREELARLARGKEGGCPWS